MEFDRIFKVYSRRQPRPERKPKPLTAEFRTRVVLRCHEVFERSGLGRDAWASLEKKLVYLHGNLHLGDGENPRDRVIDWLSRCSDEHFLDALEYIFQGGEGHSTSALEPLVDDINVFLRADGLPYTVTKYIWEDTVGDGMFAGMKGQRLAEFPRVIRADSQAAQAIVVQPALELLADGRFRAANAEFLAALEDYRKGNYADCLTKCGSAFESVLKVICETRGWPYKTTDTAAPLLKTVIDRSGLEGWFEQPLTLVATIRNRLSSSHGAGLQPRDVTPAKAEYAMNATAAAMLFLVKHCL